MVYFHHSVSRAEQEPRAVTLSHRANDNDYPVPSYLAEVFQKPEG